MDSLSNNNTRKRSSLPMADEIMVEEILSFNFDDEKQDSLSKNTLQEFCQSKLDVLPIFSTLRTYGKPHIPLFDVQCCVGKKTIRVFGGSKIKESEQFAAVKMWQLLTGYYDMWKADKRSVLSQLHLMSLSSVSNTPTSLEDCDFSISQDFYSKLTNLQNWLETSGLPEEVVQSYSKTLQEMKNRIMHSQNGNTSLREMEEHEIIPIRNPTDPGDSKIIVIDPALNLNLKTRREVIDFEFKNLTFEFIPLAHAWNKGHMVPPMKFNPRRTEPKDPCSIVYFNLYREPCDCYEIPVITVPIGFTPGRATSSLLSICDVYFFQDLQKQHIHFLFDETVCIHSKCQSQRIEDSLKLYYSNTDNQTLNPDGYAAFLAKINNRIQHSTNGNVNNRKRRSNKAKKANASVAKQVNEVKQEVKEVEKVVKRSNRKLPNVPAINHRALRESHVNQNKLMKTPRFSYVMPRDRVQRIADFLRAIMDPRNASEVRLATNWSDIKTTVLQPYTRFNVPFVGTNSVVSGTYQYIPNTEFVAFFFRNPLRNLVYYFPNYSGGTIAYAATFLLNGAPSGVSETLTFLASFTDSYGWTPNIIYYQSNPANGNTFPHGNYLYCAQYGKGSSRRYVWMDAGTTILLNMNITGAVTDADLCINDYVVFGGYAPAKTRFQYPLNTGANALSFVLTKSGYHGFDFDIRGMNSSGATANLSYFILKSTTSTWAHIPVNNNKSFSLVESCPSQRMLGVDFWFANTDSEQYIGGSIAQIQIPNGDDWTNYIPILGTSLNPPPVLTSSYGLISSLKGSDARTGKKGSDMYLKPTEDADFRFQDPWDVESGVVTDSKYSLDSEESFGAWSYQGNATSQSGFITAGSYLECTTTDLTRPTGVSLGHPTDIFECQVAIRSAPQYFDNPSHLLSILKAIKIGAIRTIDTIMNVAPVAKNILNSLPL